MTALPPSTTPQRIWQALLVLALGLLAWRIAAVGLASVQVRALDTGDATAARQALVWYPGQAAALYRQGLELHDDDPAAATEKLTAAFTHNPTNPRPLLVLAGLALANGDAARADRLVAQVDALRPSNADLQRDLGQYWLQRQRPEQAFQHWSRAIAADPGLAPPLFATFRQLFQDPSQTPAFTALTRNPPDWWTDFFVDTAQRGQDLSTLRRLYRLRREAPAAPLTQAERQAYYERLLREGLSEEAYLAWVNSLNPTQRQQLGPLYNGSFELPLLGHGFDWRIEPLDRVDVTRAPFEGESKNALRLRFRLLRTPYRHLVQPLLLAPGAYELTGKSRDLHLLTEGGFRWQVRCRAPAPALLGESERIFGSDAWSAFRFEFEVPDTCRDQELRLVSADDAGREILTDGELWFAQLGIRRLAALSPLTRGKLEASRMEALGTATPATEPPPSP